MKTILSILSLSVLSLACVRADDAPAAIELKNKSAFTLDASGRNPFWPIGWKPVAGAQTTTDHSGSEILPTAVVVRAITLVHGAGFGVINVTENHAVCVL